ncbi:uncharacterized protein LOC125650063 [Ostrea edulis]|uniref:uncharacterized protein LOC125650063 n=1 Tax=Ostrea edulis TaxID=37623 RepID=UPI002096278A|nr:uncharacterized protein LOC125650063 [Ostrea edulis]
MTTLGLISVLVCVATVLGNTDYKVRLFGHFHHNVQAGSQTVGVLNQADFQRLFHSLGSNMHDFETAWRSQRLPCDNGARLFFSEMDGDKSGHIDTNEITYFFNLFDANEDQEVTQDEFTAAWSVLFDEYLHTHQVKCSHHGGDDDDRK